MGKKKQNEVLCKHRHSVKTHPACFSKGVVKEELQKPYAKILLLDIETSPIEVLCWGLWEQNINIEAILQDWHLLSWSAKWLFDSEIMSDVLTSKEAKNHDDSRIASSIWELLNVCDVVITHNGNSFDIKRMNTRFLKHGIMPPKAFQSIDTLKVVKEVFNLSSNKLDYICQFLGLPAKEHTTFNLWRKCFEGDEESLLILEKYNRNDTEILEDMYLKVRPFVKSHPNVNLWSEDNVSRCPNCGCDKLTWEGHYYTITGRYQAFRCNECKAIGRSRLMDLDKDKRKTVVR